MTQWQMNSVTQRSIDPAVDPVFFLGRHTIGIPLRYRLRIVHVLHLYALEPKLVYVFTVKLSETLVSLSLFLVRYEANL